MIKPKPGSYFRFIDLFAGLGGFHLALKRLGGECVFASEIDERLRETYRLNHEVKNGRIVGDIRLIKPSEIPDHDVLAAGFPCQPFSKAGYQKGFECETDGNLFFKIEQIVRVKKPTYVLLENVPNIKAHDEGRTLQQILSRLKKSGYEVDIQILSPHQFGIPQRRLRAYIVGSKRGLKRFKWPVPSQHRTDIRDVLDKEPKDFKKISPVNLQAIELWDEIVDAVGPSRMPGFPIWSMEWEATYPFETRSPYSYILNGATGALKKYRGSHGASLRAANDILDALPAYARYKVANFPEWKKRFINLNRLFYLENKAKLKPFIPRLREIQSSMQKLEWHLSGETTRILNQVIQLRPSGIRVKTSQYAPSLVAMTDTQIPIIGWQRRHMSIKECLRLQSLDELAYLPDNQKHTYKALGNAVNASVVGLISKSLLIS